MVDGKRDRKKRRKKNPDKEDGAFSLPDIRAGCATCQTGQGQPTACWESSGPCMFLPPLHKEPSSLTFLALSCATETSVIIIRFPSR